MELTKSNFNRLAKLIMVKDKIPYDKALEKLKSFKIMLCPGKEIGTSKALQAAFLTAVNTSKRSFLGGVSFDIPANTPLLIPYSQYSYLNEAAKQIVGDCYLNSNGKFDFTICFGECNEMTREIGINVQCDGWRFLLEPIGQYSYFIPKTDFALAGVAAGSLSVARAFFYVTNIDTIERSQSLSLWNPGIEIVNPEAFGPNITILPKRIWMLGLGHLGQAYLWTLSFLPYNNKEKAEFLLQDFDFMEDANYSAGLLTEKVDIGKLKTRICSKYLENRDFKTLITERAFDENTKRCEEEPSLALCGFDSAESRRLLDVANFSLIIDCGVGSNMEDFDGISLHTLKQNEEKASEIWIPIEPSKNDEEINTLMANVDKCGIINLANTTISTSFVGGFASALAISEILRGLHNGKRLKALSIELKDIGNLRPNFGTDYSTELAINGFFVIE